jgi:hypothetical protein
MVTQLTYRGRPRLAIAAVAALLLAAAAAAAAVLVVAGRAGLVWLRDPGGCWAGGCVACAAPWCGGLHLLQLQGAEWGHAGTGQGLEA